MSIVRVWAPRKRAVEIIVSGRSQAMSPDDDGWWQTSGELAVGTDYALSIDGGSPRPDPRSAWQPAGVHGASRRYDHAAFSWTDRSWRPPALDGAVIYELHVGTFSDAGTFDGVVERLDYLVKLGVSHLELMPVNQFPGERGWGYDGVDLFAPHHAYGGPDGLKRLVDACHAKGLAVLLDVVYNHLGPSGNYLAEFGPYFTAQYSTPWGMAVNLDQADSHQVRQFFCDNALMWLRDYHVDGLRLDAVHALHDSSAYHFLEQLADQVEALGLELGRRLVLIAESDLADPRIVRPRAAGGLGMDAQWSDDLHHGLHALLTGERQAYYADYGGLLPVVEALRHGFLHRGTFSVFRRKLHGHPHAGPPAARLLGYAQTHDQVGNRARGERLGHLVSPALAKQAAALVLCSPFVPLLFQGEEWNASSPFLYFTAHDDPELGRQVREGRRREFGAFGWRPEDVPDPQDPATFARSKLRWEELGEGDHAEMLAWYRALIALRRARPSLAGAPLEVDFDARAGWLVLHRGELVLAANFDASERELPVGGVRAVLLASGEVRNGPDRLSLGGSAVALVERGPG